jgi:two-component system, OmpR family, osmolarity sensor histidine kinase EnvZ
MKKRTFSVMSMADRVSEWLLDSGWSRWLPATLMGRSAMIILVPLILVQIISTFIFYDNHWETLSRRLAQGLAGDISHIRIYMRDNPTPQDFRWIQESARQTMQLDVSFEADAALPAVDTIDAGGPFPDVLTRELWRELKRPFTIDFEKSAREIEINMQLPDGILHVLAPRKRLFSSTTYVFVLWMVGSSLLLFGVAALFLNVQVRAVRRLARAADSFGKGLDVPNFKPEGAREVRQAAWAFTAMRNRIQRQIDQRTEMLAGVSHDLRTPLTRLRLQVEMLDGAEPKDIEDIKEDIDEMERMLNGYLAFARGDGDESPQSTDLHNLLNDIHRQFQRNQQAINLRLDDLGEPIATRRLALRRCLANLISNATRYGSQVDVSARRTRAHIEINIDDNGPGIPSEQRENVFKAFYRIDSSRNPETGGVGLGMTIARDIARSLGGEILLSDSPIGGLRSTVRLPV